MSPGLRGQAESDPVFMESALPFQSAGHAEMPQICASWHFAPWCLCSGSRAQEATKCLLRRKGEGDEQKGEGSSCFGPLQQAQSPSCLSEAQIRSRCGELCLHRCHCWEEGKCQGRCRSGPPQSSAVPRMLCEIF